uniref:Uncharacterized protein n=1 Tax=Hyaloperonospora arabidopsidis (strain Emoy2) TaxID=559515 RepID=M4BBL2_HYAAE
MTLVLSQGCSTRKNVGVQVGRHICAIGLKRSRSNHDRLPRAKGGTKLTTQGHLQAYLGEAMERFQQEQREQAYQAIYPSQRVKTPRVQEAYTPDVEM